MEVCFTSRYRVPAAVRLVRAAGGRCTVLHQEPFSGAAPEPVAAAAGRLQL